jgi:hypothetical protein
MRFRRHAVVGPGGTTKAQTSLGDTPSQVGAQNPGTRKDRSTVSIIRIARRWSALEGKAPLDAGDTVETPYRGSAEVPDPDGLDAFGSEVETPAPSEKRPPSSLPAAELSQLPSQPRTRGNPALGWVLLFVAAAGVIGVGVWRYKVWEEQRSLASLVLETTPAGADVIIRDRLEGKTPLTLALPPGEYAIRLVSGSGLKRELAVVLTGGVSAMRHIEFPAVAPALPSTGAVHIQTDPPRLSVSIDGLDRGSSPVTVNGLEPGDHQVVVRGGRGVVRQRVTVQAGNTTSLVISPVESNAVVPGWLAVNSPVTLQLREGGRLIGTTEAERLMLPIGDHSIELSNESLGYSSVRRFNVAAGKTTRATVELPMGTLSINALPWAEVWLDGERMGQTPIANLARRLGTHEVVFRHPQFGERRATVTVTARQPARIGLDMRRQ